MYEVPETPKKEIPYPWIVAGLSVLSVSLLLVMLNEWSTPAKNSEPPVGLLAGGSRERLLQEQVEALNTELASVRAKQVASASKVAQVEAESRANAQRLVEAEGRVSELKAQLAGLRKEEATPQKVKETMSNPTLVGGAPLQNCWGAWGKTCPHELSGRFKSGVPNAAARGGLSVYFCEDCIKDR